MINITGFDHLNLYVKNLEESEKFYRENFNFTLREQDVSAGGTPYKILGVSNKAYLCLYQQPESNQSNEKTFNHFGIHVEDFDQVTKALQQKEGVEILYGGVVKQGKSRSLYLLDPSGIEIEVTEKFGGDL